MGIQTALDAVRDAERLVDAMRLADELAFEAGRDGGARTIRVLAGAVQGDDQLVSIAAVHALGHVYDEQADVVLTALLSHEHRFLAEHAAWVLQSRLPRLEALGRLIAVVAEGGFGGMVAQRTLEQWSTAAGPSVAVALEGALVGVREEEPRARLVETLGLVRDRIATDPLLRIAASPQEGERVRAAAVMALGQRRGDERIAVVLDREAHGTGFLADSARLALVDLAAATAPRIDPADGLTIAQLFLHADIDAGLSAAGSGDNGGVATLLVRLGDALVEPAGPVRRVLTMSRGSAVDALAGVVAAGSTDAGHVYGRIPLLSDPVAAADAWPLRVAARRGIRRILRAAGGADVLHLRMADVGSLAASDVARELDIPVVFTVAPDPHAVIQSLDLAGRLTRAAFGAADEIEHFWFRARLVQRLASSAAHTVLFPRLQLERDMRSLLGIDVTAHPERHTVVPEGVDLEVADLAVAEAAAVAAGQQPAGALDELRDLLAALPPHRRGLPVLMSVGRLHRVKGMSSIVEAWAHGPLAARANLLLVGGDLAHPSADEREQLAAIDAIVPADARGAAGLLLPGHRRNDTVARWMAAVRFGVPSLAAPRGVYVCGSVKEEFGIALLEAMATGLLVVAPDGGGPATYVADGDTGFLTRTWDVAQMRATLLAALDAAAAEPDDARALRSRAMVERDFTIQAMARTLTRVYGGVQEEERRMRQLVAPMTLLVISPDYASHLLPLATLGTAWLDAGERVVVATGEATAGIVASFGFERAHLQLGRGSNPGVIRAEQQVAGEDDALRGFFTATRQGMIPTLAFQAEARLDDLMWQPVETARAVLAVVTAVQPDAVLVDHLAFSARLALTAARVPHADVVLGHPTALPVGDESYGFPPAWPTAFSPDPGELAALRALCQRVTDRFTAEWNGALAQLDPAAPAVQDAFAAHGDLLLLNYPAELTEPERTARLPAHVFLGSAVREEPADREVEAWLAATDRFVYVSFGSFLSVRADVLARVMHALQALGLPAAIATGSADPALLPPVPADWLVREFLPQVTLLDASAAAVTHGGNNSVTEAMTAGVPLLVLPFSTDQFAGAAALERTGFGVALAPNTASVDELVDGIARALRLGADPGLAALSARLRERPGRDRAYSALGANTTPRSAAGSTAAAR